jgi:hypothetical protein
MKKIVLTTEIQGGSYFPLDELNKLEGVEAEIVDNTAIIIVDGTKYTTPQSMFMLGRFIELRISNYQLKASQQLIKSLLGHEKL